MSIKGQQIADYAQSKDGCPYIWGAYGENICTPSFRKQRVAQYPEQKQNTYSNCPVLSGKQSSCKGCKYEGKQSYDCAQLTIYSARAVGEYIPAGATSQWRTVNWERKGTIDTLPEAPGVMLYRKQQDNPNNMGHTGVYLGGNRVEEAKNAKFGVVNTHLLESGWTHWAALPGVLVGDEPLAEPEKDNYSAKVYAANGYPVNMRKGPNSSYDVVAKVPVGGTVLVLGHGTEWDCIKYDGKVGYMSTEFLTSLEKQPTPVTEELTDYRLELLRLGSTGYHVHLLQRLLNMHGCKLGLTNDEYGTFNQKTLEGLIRFHEKYNIPVNGNETTCDTKTWQYLLG